MSICPICEKEILDTDLIFYIPFDIPYYNLKIHREHFKECGNMAIFHSRYGKICYNSIVELLKTEENKDGKNVKKRCAKL